MTAHYMTSIRPVMSALMAKYGIFEPFTQHQQAVLSMYFSEALTRIFGYIVCPDQQKMSGYPLTTDEMKLIADSSMDPLITQTMSFEVMSKLNSDAYYSCRVSSSVALIISGI